MAGYGNRSKWTVGELLRRNEQAKALGQQGLSDDQVGAGMEGAIAADLADARQAEGQLMNYNIQRGNQYMQNRAYKDAAAAQTIGGYRQLGEAGYKAYKEYQNPNSPLSRGIEKTKQVFGVDDTSKMVRQGTNTPTEDQYGPNTIDVGGKALGQTTDFATELSGDTWGAELAGAGKDMVSQMSGLTGAIDPAWNMVDAATNVADVASNVAEGVEAGTEVANMASDAAAGAAQNIPYVGIAIKLAKLGYQVANGQYAQALSDVVLGPVAMLGGLAQLATGSTFMDDAYTDINQFLKSPGKSLSSIFKF